LFQNHSPQNTGKVIFGVTIKLSHGNSEELTYQIVGEDEADIKQNKISVTSPVARALIGKFEGDAVQVTTPEGVTTYTIEEVNHL
jgi:transcription elongation factor GreA